jgi:hypothetical protein
VYTFILSERDREGKVTRRRKPTNWHWERLDRDVGIDSSPGYADRRQKYTDREGDRLTGTGQPKNKFGGSTNAVE